MSRPIISTALKFVVRDDHILGGCSGCEQCSAGPARRTHGNSVLGRSGLAQPVITDHAFAYVRSPQPMFAAGLIVHTVAKVGKPRGGGKGAIPTGRADYVVHR